MFPWIYEFHWTAGHLIFLGVFFTVVTVIVASVTVAAWRASDTRSVTGRQEHVSVDGGVRRPASRRAGLPA